MNAAPARPSRATVALILGLAWILPRAAALPEPGFQFDQEQFFGWPLIARYDGLGRIYDSYEFEGRVRRWCNYPPLYPLILRGLAGAYTGLTGREFTPLLVRAASTGVVNEATAPFFWLFKLPATAADLAIAIVVYRALSRRWNSIFGLVVAALLVAQPAVVHDSAVWGQVDSVHSLWMILSLEAALARQPLRMTLWATLGLLTKLQAIVLGPVWLIGIWAAQRGKPDAPLRVLGCFGVAAMTIGAVIAPYGMAALPGIRDAYFGAVGFWPYVHMHAFNLWFVINPLSGPQFTFDHLMRDNVAWIAGITPRQLGLIAVGVLTVATLVRLVRRRGDACSLQWAARFLPLGFFLVSTQMHERYLLPVLFLWAATARPARQWWLSAGAVTLVSVLDQMTVFAGPPRGWIGPQLANWLQHAPTATPIGVACALLLIAALVSEWFFDESAQRRSSLSAPGSAG